MKIKSLKEIIIITGKIHCISGLCIGGNSSTLEIGGVSQEVIKNPITQEPYIPGSSLKGKMRSELEKRGKNKKWISRDDLKKKENWEDIKILEKKKIDMKEYVMIYEMQEPCGCGKEDCLICSIFGAHTNSGAESGPTRSIFRDALLSDKSRIKVEALPFSNQSYFERKVENIVKRDTGTAGSPRTIERVIAGLSFDFEIILRIFDGDDAKKMLDFVIEGLKAVESSYLGGSGSRGYGQVKFDYAVKHLDLRKV